MPVHCVWIVWLLYLAFRLDVQPTCGAQRQLEPRASNWAPLAITVEFPFGRRCRFAREFDKGVERLLELSISASAIRFRPGTRTLSGKSSDAHSEVQVRWTKTARVSASEPSGGVLSREQTVSGTRLDRSSSAASKTKVRTRIRSDAASLPCFGAPARHQDLQRIASPQGYGSTIRIGHPLPETQPAGSVWPQGSPAPGGTRCVARR